MSPLLTRQTTRENESLKNKLPTGVGTAKDLREAQVCYYVALLLLSSSVHNIIIL